jgi:hypothetical protein
VSADTNIYVVLSLNHHPAYCLRSKKFTLDAVGHMGALPILTRLSKKVSMICYHVINPSL